MKNKVAIITGASKGIGRAIALKFAAEGIETVLTARNREGLLKTAELIKISKGPDPLVIPADLIDAREIDRLADTILEKKGQIDILVNNAGVMIQKPFIDLTWEEYRIMMAVNLDAVFLLTKAILPQMIEQQRGDIINIASLAGKNPVKNGTIYAASKWALRGFASSLMMEVRDKNIRVITVFPGSVDTAMLADSKTAPLRDYRLQSEDVAHAVYAGLSVHPRAMMSEIDIRPSNPKKS